MNFNPISLRFNNFNPSARIQEHVQNIINEIHKESPYGATLRASFFKKEKAGIKPCLLDYFSSAQSATANISRRKLG